MTGTIVVCEAELLGEEGEGELVAWHVEDGATVEAGQPIAQIATSKVMVDIPAPVAGRLSHQAEPGQIVRAGEAFAHIR